MTILSELYQQKSDAFTSIIYHTGMCVGIPVVAAGVMFVTAINYLNSSRRSIDGGETAIQGENLSEGVVKIVWSTGIYACPLLFVYHLISLPIAAYRWWTIGSSIESVLSRLI